MMVEMYHHLPRDDRPGEKKARGSSWDATLLDLSFLKFYFKYSSDETQLNLDHFKAKIHKLFPK